MTANDQLPAGRALVTHSRGLQSLAVIRSLGAKGVEVIAADEYRVTPGALSRYTLDTFQYPPAETETEAFVGSMLEAVDRFFPGPDAPYVLIPVHRETQILARYRERFEGRIRLPLARPEQFEVMSHKGKLWRFAREAGVPAPETWFPKTAEDVERAAAEVRYPAFVKIPTGVAGVGVLKANQPDEVKNHFLQLIETHGLSDDLLPFVQEGVPGDDYCTMAMCENGRALVTMTYKNVATFPRGSGPGAIRETVVAPALESMAEKLFGAAGWHGIAQADFRWTGDEGDVPMLLEVNPRFGSGLFQAIESGVDYPYLLFQMALGRHVEPPRDIVIGARTETPLLGLLATVAEIAEGSADFETLKMSWEESKRDLMSGHPWEALRKVLSGLDESLDVQHRGEHLKRLLEENKDNVSVLFDEDDPLPALGLVYPLAVFLRHGKVSRELLVSAQ